MNKHKCLCGSEKIKELFSLKKENKLILRCEKCRLAWTYPSPVVDYKDYDFSDYFKYKKVHQSRAIQLVDLIKNFKNKGKLLELGCGPGFLLEVARSEGFEIKGIDLCGGAINKARELLGENSVEHKDAQDFTGIGLNYDVVVMDNYLEHVKNPLQTLIDIKRILNDKGILFICSPNIDGLYIKLIREGSYILRPGEHIWQLSKTAIKNLFSMAGYKTLKIKKVGFINKSLFLHNLRFFGFNKLQIKNLFLNYLNYLLGVFGLGDMVIAIAEKG